MEGYIWLHREIQNHWIFKKAEYYRAWSIMILNVNHTKAKVLINRELMTCERGESLKTLNTWAKLFGNKWSIQKVRTFFKLLSNDNMILICGKKTTRLSIVNYDKYNTVQHDANTTPTRRQHDANTTPTTNNKEKKENNKKKDKKERAKDFAEKLASFKETYPRELLKAFYEYWTESGDKDKKMRFEKTTSYDINKRLVTWKNRENNYGGQKKTSNKNFSHQWAHINKTEKYEHEKIEGYEPLSEEENAIIDNMPF